MYWVLTENIVVETTRNFSILYGSCISADSSTLDISVHWYKRHGTTCQLFHWMVYKLQCKSLNQVLNNSLTNFFKRQRMRTYLQFYTQILYIELPFRFSNITSILRFILPPLTQWFSSLSVHMDHVGYPWKCTFPSTPTYFDSTCAGDSAQQSDF